MAKALREPPPTSSVARLFDLNAAARATSASTPAIEAPATPASGQRIEPDPRPSAQPPARASEAWLQQPTIKRELVLTPSTDDTFSALVELLRRSTGTRLTASHVARALLKGVAHCMDQIEREARRLGRQKLPANARGREMERERFESLLADAIISGVRASAAFDPHHK